MELILTAVDKAPAQANLAVSEQTFGQDFNETLVHQVVNAHLAGARAGTKAQKNRAAVSGGGAKPWRQKGTGRARAGTSRSPIWTGGGVTFAAQPRNFSQKVNRKMFRVAMRSIFSELVRQDRLILVEDITLAEPKTSELCKLLKKLDASDVLIIKPEIDTNLILSARNIPNVYVTTVEAVDPVSLVGAKKIIITVSAVKALEERLA